MGPGPHPSPGFFLDPRRSHPPAAQAIAIAASHRAESGGHPPPCAVATVAGIRKAMYLSVGAHDVSIDVPCVLMAIDGISAGWSHSRLITTSK
jgi:hypothetical protein